MHWVCHYYAVALAGQCIGFATIMQWLWQDNALGLSLLCSSFGRTMPTSFKDTNLVKLYSDANASIWAPKSILKLAISVFTKN